MDEAGIRCGASAAASASALGGFTREDPAASRHTRRECEICRNRKACHRLHINECRARRRREGCEGCALIAVHFQADGAARRGVEVAVHHNKRTCRRGAPTPQIHRQSACRAPRRSAPLLFNIAVRRSTSWIRRVRRFPRGLTRLKTPARRYALSGRLEPRDAAGIYMGVPTGGVK